MKGIILAGGAGTRLYPLTQVVSKQLMAVYDKPMIYYPLSTLMLGGIRDILIVSTPQDIPRFQYLLGDGARWGLNLQYKVQERPEGIAQAFILGKDFIGSDHVTLILGDNIFYGKIRLDKIITEFKMGARVFGYFVKDPQRYGVVEFDDNQNVKGIEEKPKKPKSSYAVPGLYIYDNQIVTISENLKPSPRGELEITDVNLEYLKKKELKVELLGRGIAWLDTGTHSSLLEASNFIYTLEARQDLKIGCPEEIAFIKGFINKAQFDQTIDNMPKSPYREYLENRFLSEKSSSQLNLFTMNR